MKNLVIDLDNTLTIGETSDYENIKPNNETIKTLIKYKEKGFNIVIFTSRNMRTYDGKIGKINKNTLPTILGWLEKYKIPFDEIIVGKPWCGHDGFYVDDKSIRPSEFNSLSYHEIQKLIEKEVL